MTKDEINRAIAETGLFKFPELVLMDGKWFIHRPNTHEYYESLNPAERIDHAWMVVEKMAEKFHWSIRSPFFKGEPWFAGLTPCGVTGWNGRPDFDCHADTAPMAICLAALKAKEGE